MNRGKRLDIQALRAIAVLSVVIYHLWPGRVIGGFMGVDIFFVISGYLMTITLMRDIQPVLVAKKKIKATGIFLANFYARRIKRLIPAASVTLLATLGLLLATGNLSLIEETAKQISASALFIQNWFLANNAVDYLANTDPTAVQHFWSLSLEEQFYLVWPLLLLVLLLVSGLAVFRKKKWLSNLAAISVLLLIAGFFVYGYHLTKTQPSLAYFVTPARVWELLIGGMIAFLPIVKNYDLRLLLPWVGFGMIGYSLFTWGGDGFPGWHALIPTLGTALIIYGGSMANESKWSFEHMLRHKPIQWIGNISYSLYLWHWPLIILLPVLLFVDLDAYPQATLIKFGILALSLVMAYVSYRYIEQTTQHIKIKKRYVYISFLIITGLVASLAYFASGRAESSLRTSVKDVRAAVQNNTDSCVGAQSVFNNCEKSLGFLNNNYSQTAFNDKYDYLLDSKTTCSSVDGRKNNAELTSFCIVGDLNSKREITVWGDSHAQHWINPMDKIGRENNIKVNVIGTSYCFSSGKLSKNCTTRFNSIQKSGVLDRSESIIVAMWYNATISSPGNNIANAIKTLRTLTNNDNVYVLEDTPVSGPNGGPDCSMLRLSCKNAVRYAIGGIEESSRDLVEMKLIEQSKIITIKDMFCDDNYCYSNIGGIPVYRDKKVDEKNKNAMNSHMTATFAYSTWPMIEKKLKESGALKE